MHIGCRHKIAAALRDAEAGCILQFKVNHPTLLKNIEDSVAEVARRRRPGEARAQIERHRDVENGHGRIEARSRILLHDLSGIENGTNGGSGRHRGNAARTRSGPVRQEVTGKQLVHRQQRCGNRGRRLVIENGLHWRMDVVGASDAQKTREPTGAENDESGRGGRPALCRGGPGGIGCRGSAV